MTNANHSEKGSTITVHPGDFTTYAKIKIWTQFANADVVGY